MFTLSDQTKSYSVYCLTSPTGRKYIGCTSFKDINRKRWRYGWGYKNQELNNDIKKYGFKSFKTEILKTDLTREVAEQYEREYIFFTENPYNKTCKTVKYQKDDLRNDETVIFSSYTDLFTSIIDDKEIFKGVN